MGMQKSRTDIVEYALTLVGAKAAEESPTGADYQIAAEALNDLVCDLQATGAHLWQRDFATIFTNSGQRIYRIGGTNTDRAVRDEDLVQTTVATAIGTAGATNGVMTSVEGIEIGDVIGITLNAGTIAFRNVQAITDNTVVFDGDLIMDVDVGNRVYAYPPSAQLGKILRIPTARRIEVFSGSPEFQEIPMVQMGRTDYEELPNKETSGTPVQYYYDPKIDDGLLYLWPVPDNTITLVNATVYIPLDVFDDSESAADFPNEWTAALKYQLALRIAPLYDANLSPIVAQQAERSLTNALTWDQGDAPIHFTYSPTRWR